MCNCMKMKTLYSLYSHIAFLLCACSKKTCWSLNPDVCQIISGSNGIACEKLLCISDELIRLVALVSLWKFSGKTDKPLHNQFVTFVIWDDLFTSTVGNKIKEKDLIFQNGICERMWTKRCLICSQLLLLCVLAQSLLSQIAVCTSVFLCAHSVMVMVKK